MAKKSKKQEAPKVETTESPVEATAPAVPPRPAFAVNQRVPNNPPRNKPPTSADADKLHEMGIARQRFGVWFATTVFQHLFDKGVDVAKVSNLNLAAAPVPEPGQKGEITITYDYDDGE